MLDIAFHIAVLIVIVFGIGLFAFHHSLYDYLLGNMKGAIKEKFVTNSDNKVGNIAAQQPARLIERKESDIEKALLERMDEPSGSGTTAGVK